MKGSAVIFDLDGTLLDTLVDLAETTNLVLEQHHYPTHPIDDYRFLVGDGVRVLFERALPDEIEGVGAARDVALDQCVEAFHREYANRWNQKSSTYAGVPELLDSLSKRNVPMGVLSNKPHAFTLQCVETLLGNWNFSMVLGQRDGVPRKPDPAGVYEMLAAWKLPAEQCLYVGDTNTDMRTGTAAGCITIGVTWGFRPREELLGAGANRIIDTPSELLELLI